MHTSAQGRRPEVLATAGMKERVRGRVIIISTVVTHLVSSSFIQHLIYVNRSRVEQVPMKGGVRDTPPTLVCATRLTVPAASAR